MKKIISVWAGLMLWLGGLPLAAAPAIPPEDLFAEANAAFQAEHYQEARQLYDSLYQMGYRSAALEYNLGNTHFELGHLGRAILHYERALYLKPGDEEVLHNLQLARERTVDRIEALPSPLFIQWYRQWLALFSPDFWAVLAQVFAFAMLLGLAFYLFTPRRRGGFAIALGSLLLALLSLSSGILRQRYLQKHQPAIVMQKALYVKSGPAATAEDAFILHEGTRVELSESYQDWVKLRLADGKLGWARSEGLLRVRPH